MRVKDPDYPAIQDHGIIGDLHTVALVTVDGTIDWCCIPRFDSPSVFGAILDAKKGGWLKLRPAGECTQKQMYLPDSNILVTRSYTPDGLGEVQDFMPIARRSDVKKVHQIVRRLSCVRGEIEYVLDCRPAFDYGRAAHKVKKGSEGVIFETAGDKIYGLSVPGDVRIEEGCVRKNIQLKEGDALYIVFFCIQKSEVGDDPFAHMQDPSLLFDETIHFWQSWISRCSYKGRWSEMVYRSALTLKLLTFEPTGAIIAAPTTSLPEQIGGGRNWDYRYTWIRDASFTLYALMRIGYHEEAERFMHWLIARCEEAEGSGGDPLQIMYGIDGRHELPEMTLDHLEGYRKSFPVRIGNAAAPQLQLDIYGEMMDSVYLYNKYVNLVSHREWVAIRRIVEWLGDNWDQPDEGVWETRGGRKNFVFSRLMSWVAMDRASRMSLKHSLPGDRVRWMRIRDDIYDQIMTQGWNEERKCFRQHYGSDALDASNLLMPLVKFISPTDERMIGTIDATLKHLTADTLVYRYDVEHSPDGLVGDEGTFSICTFWLVECLTRAGRTDEAHLLFQKMLSFANHLGLYSEEIGVHGEMLGNFPQAFTHLSLISAAYNLNRVLS